MNDVPMDRRSIAATAWSATALLVLFTVVAITYTLAVTAVAAVRPAPAGDLLLSPDLAACFAGPGWFHGRPSAAVGVVSGGSNLGPTNPALATAITNRIAVVRGENPANEGPVPIDLVTASASGFDPHISPRAARLQVPRIAAVRGISEAELERLVERMIEPRSFGLIGHPRVNVVRINAALEPTGTRLPGAATP